MAYSSLKEQFINKKKQKHALKKQEIRHAMHSESNKEAEQCKYSYANARIMQLINETVRGLEENKLSYDDVKSNCTAINKASMGYYMHTQKVLKFLIFSARDTQRAMLKNGYPHSAIEAFLTMMSDFIDLYTCLKLSRDRYRLFLRYAYLFFPVLFKDVRFSEIGVKGVTDLKDLYSYYDNLAEIQQRASDEIKKRLHYCTDLLRFELQRDHPEITENISMKPIQSCYGIVTVKYLHERSQRRNIKKFINYFYSNKGKQDKKQLVKIFSSIGMMRRSGADFVQGNPNYWEYVFKVKSEEAKEDPLIDSRRSLRKEYHSYKMDQLKTDIEDNFEETDEVIVGAHNSNEGNNYLDNDSVPFSHLKNTQKSLTNIREQQLASRRQTLAERREINLKQIQEYKERLRLEKEMAKRNEVIAEESKPQKVDSSQSYKNTTPARISKTESSLSSISEYAKGYNGQDMTHLMEKRADNLRQIQEYNERRAAQKAKLISEIPVYNPELEACKADKSAYINKSFINDYLNNRQSLDLKESYEKNHSKTRFSKPKNIDYAMSNAQRWNNEIPDRAETWNTNKKYIDKAIQERDELLKNYSRKSDRTLSFQERMGICDPFKEYQDIRDTFRHLDKYDDGDYF